MSTPDARPDGTASDHRSEAVPVPAGKLCRELADALAATPCRYPLMEGSNKYCYWHRLMRTSPDAQVRESERRLGRAEAVDGFARRERVRAEEWPTGERWCSGCQTFVPLFYCSGSRCKGCALRIARVSRRENVYGIDDPAWREIMRVQRGRCGVCRKRQQDRSLAVEHNHGTGVVRGGACKRCNHDLLGAGFDSPNMMLAALVYLLAPPTSGLWLAPEEHGDELMDTVKAKILEINGRKCGQDG